MKHSDFQLAGGSYVGRDHRLVAKNNQDGFHIVHDETCTVAVVTDGCGSGAHSEVGAQVGARLVCEAVRREAQVHGADNVNWPKVRLDVLAALHVLATQMGGNFRVVVNEFFLFTLVGVVLGAETATFFALGDGVIVVNGITVTIGPFPENKPPYIGYGLLEGRQIDVAAEDLTIKATIKCPLDELDNFLIGCDGVSWASSSTEPPGLLDLCEADVKLPGVSKTIGSIERFWSEDQVFENPVMVSRRLTLISRDWPKRNPEPGLLADDATLVVGRRTPAATLTSVEEG